MTNTIVTAEKFERILNKVRALLAKADSTEFPEEAATYREGAERLMREYKIAEEQTLAADPQALVPEWLLMDLCEEGDFIQQFYTMWHYIAEHVGVRYRQTGRWEGERYLFTMQVVGYASDLRLADLLYTSARLGFSAKLTPGVDPSLSEAENIYRLRSAGLTRGRVAELLWGGQTHQRNAKVGSVYKAECEKRGETPALDGRGTSAGLHRKVYAREFALEIARRLRRARDGVDSQDGALQMFGREERVAEALYARYPEMRPSTEVAERRPCAKCEKRTDGSPCADHRRRGPTKAALARMERENFSATARAAKRAGRAAAAEVQLDGSAPVKRIDRYTEGERADTRAIWGAIEGR